MENPQNTQNLQSTNNQIFLRSKGEVLFLMFIIYRKLQRLYKNNFPVFEDDKRMSEIEYNETVDQVFKACGKIIEWLNLLISCNLLIEDKQFFQDLLDLIVDVRKDLGDREELVELGIVVNNYYDFSFGDRNNIIEKKGENNVNK